MSDLEIYKRIHDSYRPMIRRTRIVVALFVANIVFTTTCAVFSHSLFSKGLLVMCSIYSIYNVAQTLVLINGMKFEQNRIKRIIEKLEHGN